MKKLILLLTQLFCHHRYQYTEINHDGLNTMECKWCGKRKIVKVFPLLALAFVMCGCNTPANEDGAIKLNGSNANAPQVVIIDSCEYIHWIYGLAHKGNCKFCAERRRKEQEELIRKIKEL